MRKPRLRIFFRHRISVTILLLLQVALFVLLIVEGGRAFSMTNQLLSIVSLLVVLHIVSEPNKGAYKIAWILLVLLVPLFGGVLYLLVRGQSVKGRFRKRLNETEQKAGKLAAIHSTGYDKIAARFPNQITAVRYLQDHVGFPIYDQSQTKYLSPGEEKWKCLLEELEKAERYIFLEYFIIQDGVMWQSILEILKRKAAAGVKVRVIYDDMGCFVLLPKDFVKQMTDCGIECAVFNPFRPFLTTTQNNRDHRKNVSIDGKTAFTGGINLADEYINAYEKHGHWKDASVMIRGKAAWGFTLMFLQMWELVTGKSEDYNEYDPWTDVPCTLADDGWVQPYSDSPLDKETVGEQVYLQMITGAKRYLYINTPYLIIDDSVLSALCLAAKSGVDVRIVTPHIWDKRLVHMTTRSYYRDLIEGGVKIYEYTPGFIHSKTFVADDEVATVGTVNLDFRSLYLHFECGVRMVGCRAVSELKEDFLKTLDHCQPITASDCSDGLPMRLFQQILRLFAPLM